MSDKNDYHLTLAESIIIMLVAAVLGMTAGVHERLKVIEERLDADDQYRREQGERE